MGALLALVSSSLWGTADFLAGTLSRRLPAIAVAGAAQIVGFCLMLLIATLTLSWSWAVIGSVAPWAALAAVCGLTGLVAFYQALAVGHMTIVSPIAALGVLVPLTVGLLQGEAPQPWQYVGIVVAIAGIVLASGPEISGEVGAKPVVLAVIAALMFGLFLTFLSIGSETSAVMTMTVQRFVAVLLVTGAALLARSVGGVQRSDWLLLGAIGVFDVGANLLYGIATTMGLLAVVAVLGSLYPVVTVVLAWIIHRERLSVPQYVGVGAALVGVVAISAGG